MSAIPWILIAVLIMLILLGVIAIYVLKGKKRPTDYYSLFTIGIIWFIIGIPLENSILSILGLVFMITGLIHKKDWKKNHRKWKDLDKIEKKISTIIMIILGILVLAGLVVLLLVQKGLI